MSFSFKELMAMRKSSNKCTSSKDSKKNITNNVKGDINNPPKDVINGNYNNSDDKDVILEILKEYLIFVILIICF